HEGLGKQGRSPELEKLLGKVPYLNGGLFEVHPLEQANPDIQIADQAFEKIFQFFDGYDWALDDRPLRSDKEINPDVLGYIFEKYINQKQMGAYYTKEDITEYISKNCIIPFVFNAVEKVEGFGDVWLLLKDKPDRYIYEAVLQGVDVDLPEDIAAGIGNVSKRDGWNRAASGEYALPTETWREHIARRDRCLEVRKKLVNGEVTQINDLITFNLNIRKFAEDAIAGCANPELLLAFYETISQVSVLDPTCGSGAFLFAALNILEPLYDACLNRMQWFISENKGLKPLACECGEDFEQILAKIADHPNRRYFILKSITINNLYGVDIMEEATEICKLRLFLKLVSQVEADPKKSNFGLEPLPDIDFNIRAGNTLVGFVSLNQVCESIAKEASGQKRLIFDDGVLDRIIKGAVAADQEFKRFRSLQTQGEVNGEDLAWSKSSVKEHLAVLREELDRFLAEEYEQGLSKKSAAYGKWKLSHQPFHWFVEFYGIINAGGFDVIIGNPPYVEYKDIRNSYKVHNFLNRIYYFQFLLYNELR
ncbi:MAG: DNA methyltransferase, partial [Pseudanabaena sp. ELA748]